MSKCSEHSCSTHLEQRDSHFWFFFQSHKEHRALLFNVAPFAARGRFLFLVAEIGATGCASSIIPHSSFPRLIKNFFFALSRCYHFHDLFLIK